jgi:hypothetical protein
MGSQLFLSSPLYSYNRALVRSTTQNFQSLCGEAHLAFGFLLDALALFISPTRYKGR